MYLMLDKEIRMHEKMNQPPIRKITSRSLDFKTDFKAQGHSIIAIKMFLSEPSW